MADIASPTSSAPTSSAPTSGHVVVITGGSSGIGLCTARLFARRGWRVGLIARGGQGLDKAAGLLRAGGATVATAQADVADKDELERAADALADSLGPVDVWINAAGISMYARFVDMHEDEFRRVMDVTFMGQVHGTRTALARMDARGRGVIVHVGSLVAFRGMPLQSAYCAAKYALRGFVESLRTELIHDRSRIHLAMVHPPSVNTPFFGRAAVRMPPAAAGVEQGDSPRPPPPVYQPEVIADAIWLAASERRREIKVSGTTFQLATLNQIMPGVLDRVVALVGVASQRTARRDVAGLRRPGLFDVPEGGGTIHGSWTGESRRTSSQMWFERNRTVIGLAAVGVAVALKPRRRR